MIDVHHGPLKVPEDNPIIEGEWWDLSKPNKLQISLDSEVAKDI